MTQCECVLLCVVLRLYKTPINVTAELTFVFIRHGIFLCPQIPLSFTFAAILLSFFLYIKNFIHNLIFKNNYKKIIKIIKNLFCTIYI